MLQAIGDRLQAIGDSLQAIGDSLKAIGDRLQAIGDSLQAIGDRLQAIGDRLQAIGDRLQAPSYLSRVDHFWKIRARRQRTDIGKYSFVNRSITDWNKLPEGAIWTSHGKTHIFKTGVRKVENSEGK
jgi:hypothetical protein